MSKEMTSIRICFLSPGCVCKWRVIALLGVIKAEWTSGFVEWHSGHFTALPSGQWLCFIIVPHHCAALYGPSCHLSCTQCYPAWKPFYLVRATNNKCTTSCLKYNIHHICEGSQSMYLNDNQEGSHSGPRGHINICESQTHRGPPSTNLSVPQGL